jgi:hypothetical protein
MSGEERVNTIIIGDYKKTVLEMFNSLTEMEIKASIDSAKDKPEYKAYADLYNLAVTRCREILEIILGGATNE